MKFKRKIRQPKKAKKVTLARIREIVREELEARDDRDAFQSTAPASFNLKDVLDIKPCDGGKNIHSPLTYEREEPMYFPPSPLRPVPPPPRVFTKHLEVPQPALPDCHEAEEGETNAASK